MRRSRAPGKVAILGPIALAVPFAIAAALTADSSSADEALRFRDPAIVESSGLVADGDLLVTTNDSGDTGRVFTVDGTGATVGVTRWAEDPVDVEALAPAGPGEVWVGDIGDNGAGRDSVSVTRVPVGEGDRTVAEPAVRLVYPDRAHDAEALLADPTTGRLYVATKEVFGGTLFEAPAVPDPEGDNRMRPVGPVTGIVTDGAFFPDGEHLVLRTYSRAVVYTFPALEAVGDFELPEQQQGEGLALAGPDALYLSTEGTRAPVLRMPLPARILSAMAQSAPESASESASESAARTDATASPSARPTADRRVPIQPTVEDLAAEPRDGDVWPWLFGGVVMVLITITLLRALRPR